MNAQVTMITSRTQAILGVLYDPKVAIAEGDIALTEWSKWQGGGLPGKLGTVTPFYRLVSPSPSGPTGDLPPDIGTTDMAVCKLKYSPDDDDHWLWLVIDQFYLRDYVAMEKAGWLGMSRATFYRKVDVARERIWRLRKQTLVASL